MKTANKAIAMGVTAAMATGLACAAFAQGNANTQVSTAHAHALMAKTATTVAMAHTHLHHVVNCLVGPKGTGFDTAAGDPCKGQGDGALKDTTGNAALHVKLQNALADAQAGLKADSLPAIQGDAGKAAAALQDASMKKAGGGSW